MEMFGILASLPAAFIASGLYCLFLDRFVRKFDWVSKWFRIASYFVLAAFAVEVALLLTLGAVRSRGLLGPAFSIAHLYVFLLGTPALANLLVLRKRFQAQFGISILLCTVLAFCLVLMQYGVSESLYGIDGEGGPYVWP
jgi:hypothetical protein